MSGIINKVKDALHHDSHDKSTTHTTGTHITGTHTTGTHTTGTHATGTNATGTNTSTNHGPHDSNLANKVDPRIDSDLDGSRNVSAGNPGTTGAYGSATHNTTGLGSNTHSTTGQGYGSSNTTAGPHSSNVANKIDPRVDSDLDGSKRVGGTTGTTGASGYSGTHAGNNVGTHTGTVGGMSHSTNAGPHDSNVANKVDPRVDSDLDNRGNRHGASTGGVFGTSGSHATPGSGTAQNTAGPHNSDMLNKLDPRVDADMDGSKTFMGNKTHQ